MILFRNVKESDLDDIYMLAQNSGVGITTLTKDREALKKRIDLSIRSFSKNAKSPQDELYLFVLEDVMSKKVIGTSAIKAMNGYDQDIYTYKVKMETKTCPVLNKTIEYETLNLRKNTLKYSEICTLYLAPAYRHNHNGVLLSRARFLYMAQYLERFTTKIIAEMRGVADDETGHSPFWNAVGQHFFDLSFAEADRLSSLENKQFIEDLIPSHPLYIKLLDEKAQAVIGKPHALTIPAMRILLKEGFTYKNCVDIFDVGPTIVANKHQIQTIKSAQIKEVKEIVQTVNGPRCLAANLGKDFRATMTCVDIATDTAIINRDTAKLLALKCGDAIQLSLL